MGDGEQILAKLDEMIENMKTRKDFSYMYTEDAVWPGMGRPAAVGREQISKEITMYIDDGMCGGSYDGAVLEVHGDIAIDWHYFALTNKKGKQYFEGKCVVVWKKDPNTKEWLMNIDIFNEGR